MREVRTPVTVLAVEGCLPSQRARGRIRAQLSRRDAFAYHHRACF